MKIKVTRVDGAPEDVVPARAHYNDAGADVRISTGVTLRPHETRRVPVGICLEIPDGYMGCIFPRSGLACDGVVCEIPPIDSGYRGEVCAVVTNLTPMLKKLSGGTRVGQLVIIPVVMADFVEDLGEEREDRGFGSTGV